MNAITMQINAPSFSRNNSRGSQLRIAMLVFGLALMAALMGGCSSAEDAQTYDLGYNGRTITIQKGDMIHVRMLVNVKSEARWQIVELDRTVIEPLGEPRPMGNIATGGLARIYTYNYSFKAVTSGKTTLKMLLLNPGDTTTLDSFSMTIVVN